MVRFWSGPSDPIMRRAVLGKKYVKITFLIENKFEEGMVRFWGDPGGLIVCRTVVEGLIWV